jgi:hypothetical protein
MKGIFCVVALLAVSTAALSADIPESELSLGGVGLGDTESQVLAVLGRPLAQSDTGEGVALEYAGLTVVVGWLEQAAPGKQRRVLQLDATGDDVCTPSGVCPGAPVSKASAAYGTPIEAERESGRFLEYYGKGSSCWLRLGTAGDRIQSISAVCQP